VASFEVLRQQVGVEEMREADLLITPDVGSYGTGAFSEAGAIIELGYAAGIKAVPAIKEMTKPKPWFARRARARAKERGGKPTGATPDV
jgi:hypothetical protein